MLICCQVTCQHIQYNSQYITSTIQILINLESCILDLDIHMKISSTVLSVSENEYERIMQIIFEVVIGWKDGKRVIGIIQVPLVFAIIVEKQSRYSLHAHICVCNSYLKVSKQCNRVPKFAFSNGLDIGRISPHVHVENNAVLALMIARIRVIYYVFKYMSKGCHM